MRISDWSSDVCSSDLASTDALTGLSNRAGWERDATRVYEDAGHRDAPRSLVFFDIDTFKDVNDRLGHAVGDAVLRSLGDRKSVLEGKSVSLRLDLDGSRIIKKKHQSTLQQTQP